MLARYVSAQCANFFPDGDEIAISSSVVDRALDRLEYCFSRIVLARYQNSQGAVFSHLDSDQYLVFLWFLSNELWRSENVRDASKVFLLNKALHSFNCMYDCPLPDIFLIVHGVGTVLGKAKYENFLMVYQGCTVGAVGGRDYPILGRGAALGAGAKVIGNCNIGAFASVGAGTVLYNRLVEERQTIFRGADGVLVRRKSSAPLSEVGFIARYLFE
jgi:serine O-acetyltransferase